MSKFQARLELARAQLAAARIKRGLLERRCPECDGVMGEYMPPIGLYLQKCRHCGLYSELSTMGNAEQNGHP